MLYPYLDWQRAALGAVLAGLEGPASLWGPAAAARELASRTVAALGPQHLPLDAAVRRDAGPGVAEEVVATTPFCRVVRFRRPDAADGAGRRRVVLLAPHSGYATAVISPIVAALLPLGDVVVTDWTDARLVPTRAGRLGLAEQAALAARLLRRDDGGAASHLVGISQSVPVALVAAALAEAEEPRHRPASLALLGGQADPRVSPLPVQNLAAAWPRALLEAQLVAEVPWGYPGAGRRVYPGLVQLATFAGAAPDTYLDIQAGLLLDLLRGTDGGFGRQHADIHSLADVPAELFRDMLDWSVRPPPARDGRLAFDGASLDLAPLADVPLLTVEAGADELIGRGQTHAAARLLGTRAPRASLTLPDGRHHDLFTGPTFAARVAPALRRFVGAAGGLRLVG